MQFRSESIQLQAYTAESRPQLIAPGKTMTVVSLILARPRKVLEPLKKKKATRATLGPFFW